MISWAVQAIFCLNFANFVSISCLDISILTASLCLVLAECVAFTFIFLLRARNQVCFCSYSTFAWLGHFSTVIIQRCTWMSMTQRTVLMQCWNENLPSIIHITFFQVKENRVQRPDKPDIIVLQSLNKKPRYSESKNRFGLLLVRDKGSKLGAEEPVQSCLSACRRACLRRRVGSDLHMKGIEAFLYSSPVGACVLFLRQTSNDVPCFCSFWGGFKFHLIIAFALPARLSRFRRIWFCIRIINYGSWIWRQRSAMVIVLWRLRQARSGRDCVCVQDAANLNFPSGRLEVCIMI